MPLKVHLDVTDTLRSPWRAGIQRVVCQLVRRLSEDDRLEVVPLTWSDELAGYRELMPHERALLWGEPPAPPSPVGGGSGAGDAGAWARVSARVRATAVDVLDRTHTKAAVREAARRTLLHTRHRHLLPLAREIEEPGSVFFDVDAVWNVVQADRVQLYPRLIDAGVHVAALVYDLIPLEHPEWFEAAMVEVFERTIDAQAAHAELLVAISQHTADAVTRRSGAAAPVVVPLGSDPVERPAPEHAAAPGTDGAGGVVLVVGTVEPRKNHSVVLDAFERISAGRPDARLVVVGRCGWVNDDVERRLRAHAGGNGSVQWFESVGDAELVSLYRDATVVAVPSVTEGYGLPVIEALRHGTPVVSSTGGALPEAAGGWADLVDPFDVDAWVEALERHLDDGDHNAAARRRLVDHVVPEWQDTADMVADALLSRFGPDA